MTSPLNWARFLIPAILVIAAVAGFPAQAADVPVDLELALGIDVSGSVDDEEAVLQRNGYIAAFRHGKAIVEKALGIEVIYPGFDFSNAVVARMQENQPELNIHQADVTRYEPRDQYDLVVLLVVTV
jgi:hypothetical protein